LATRPPFHEQLRYERELRGWSQADLAKKVSCDTKTVGRWENGDSFPRPYHRQLLCEILGKNAEELGLARENETGHSVRKVILSSTEHTQQKLAPERESPIVLPSHILDERYLPLPEREERWSRLLAALRDPIRSPAFVIDGLGGLGKTALAVELAQRLLQHPVQEGLLTVDDPTERAAIIAETVINTLPEETALVVRRCVLLHWFDQPLVEALLQSTPGAQSDAREVYERIISLPFIESLAWGAAFHRLTREGLLKRYTASRSELLMTAAHLAAPVYSSRAEDGPSRAEVFFCFLVAGNSELASALLDNLLEQAASRGNWRYISGLQRLQEEAEQFSFVKPLLLSEQQWILRGLAHRVQGELDAAILDYTHALEINPQNALCYLIRGTMYSEQERYEEALADYELANELDSTNAQVHINLGVIYYIKRRYEAAFSSFQRALQIDPANEEAHEYSERVLEIQSPEVATMLLHLAANHVRAGNYEQAVSFSKRALAIQEQVLGAEHLDVLLDLANLYSDRGQFAEAEPLYHRALHIQEYLAAYYFTTLPLKEVAVRLHDPQNRTGLIDSVNEPFARQIIIELAHIAHQHDLSLEAVLYQQVMEVMKEAKLGLKQAHREGSLTDASAITQGIDVILQTLVDLWGPRMCATLETGPAFNEPGGTEAGEIASVIASMFEQNPREWQVPALIKGLSRYERKARFIGALGEIGTPEAQEALYHFAIQQMQLLTDPPVFRYITRALGKAQVRQAIPLLTQIRDDDQFDAESQYHAHLALLAMGAASIYDENKYYSLKRVTQALAVEDEKGNPSDWKRVEQTAQWIEHHPDAPLVKNEFVALHQALLQALNHNLDPARTAVIKTLGKLGNADTFDRLLDRLAEGNEPSFDNARHTLQALIQLAERGQVRAEVRSSLPEAFTQIRQHYPAELQERIDITAMRLNEILGKLFL
jgi:tetratricopeptide (TPR) repeat protein/transcriptional regulator with XRE-family HTH domain